MSDRRTRHLVILIYINTIRERVSRKCCCLNNQPLDENKALTFSQSTDTFKTNTTTASSKVPYLKGLLKGAALLSGGLYFYRNPNKGGTKQLSVVTRKSSCRTDAGLDDSDNNNNITIVVLLSNNIPPQQKHVVIMTLYNIISYRNDINIELIYFRLLRLLGPHTLRFKYLSRHYLVCAAFRTDIGRKPARHTLSAS